VNPWEQFLSERPLAVIATVDGETPHAVPVEVVVDGGRVYTWGKESSKRIAHIKRTARAALVAYKGNAYVMVSGAATILRDDDENYGRITEMFLAKYQREETYGNDALVAIEPEQVIQR
jgi:nitroimidazol reductase NimA-like FMN-containing flavoprotein (pyridoxamine 5'-phosphate oxidase superfamily)